MILTAKDMHNSPAQAYREADKGETVIINHDRYPDKVFELTARERKPLFEGITSNPKVRKLQDAQSDLARYLFPEEKK
jgi:hypothetical protein